MTAFFQKKARAVRPLVQAALLGAFWGWTAVLLDGLLAARGWENGSRMLLTALATTGAAAFCLGVARMRARRRGPERLQARKARAGAQALLGMERPQALAAVAPLLQKKGLSLRAVLPDIALFDTARGTLGFGLLHLPRGSAAVPDELAALSRSGRRYRCQAVAVAPLFDPGPAYGRAAGSLSGPPLLLRAPEDFSPVYARFAPDPLPAEPRPALPQAGRYAAKLFLTGAGMVLCSLLLRTLRIPGLLLALCGAGLNALGRRELAWPL